MNNVKRSFLTSLISLVLCLTMFLGTTFAWFTDIVVSGGNIIQSGKLDAEMYWSDEYLASTDSGWTQVKDNKPIFTYDNWEPGYTEIKYIKVANAGNLNFKWKLSIEAEGKVTDLSDVIDVYYVNPVNGELTKQALAARTPDGKLTDVLANKTATEGDQLTPGGSVVLAIAFHMDELAGNEYQEKSLCDKGFSLKLLATQATGENDSFDDQYDKESEWPEIPSAGNNASADVPTDANGVVTTATTITGNGMSATVPAGTQLTQGTNKLTLSVNNVEDSKANVTLGDGEELRALDVHVSGVAKGNTTPIAVTLTEALPKGLNIGNYTLYHVEDGQTVPMTLPADGATPVHNNFTYDPVTGDVTLYMASFSEVGLIADTENAWEGNLDYSWYDADATELQIANADQLAAFGAIVGGMKKVTERVDGKYTYSDEVIQDSFAGQTVKLIADINIGDLDSENGLVFYPIGYWNNEGTYERLPADQRVNAVSSGLRNFEGTFDGNGHTIANFYHNTWEMKGDHDWYNTTTEQYYRDGMGLFGRVYGGTIKNLTVKNFSSDGEIATTGVIAAYADFGATFENIAIFDCNPRVYNIGNGGIVGCVGWYTKGETETPVTFRNITVDNSNKISALWGSYDVACGGIVGQYYPTSGQSSANYPVNAGIRFENCHVSAVMDVYNDVCANYQYYAYRYTGMLIGSVRENVTIDGHSYPKMDKITAENCTVHFGTWNDYYYCEIIDNTTASYTHDYQMSRLTEIQKFNTDNTKYLPLGAEDKAENYVDVPTSGRANYVIVDYTKGHGTENATCYHFKDGAVWTHDMGGAHNGENGEKFIDENGDGVADLKEDKQHIYLEFKNLVTGYGWGVTTKGVGDLAGVTILDREVADSVDKFTPIIKNEAEFTTESTVTIGELFKAVTDAEVAINPESVQVAVSPFGATSTAGGTYVANTTDWTQGTLTFSGVGQAVITITDYYFCKTATVTVNIVGAEKFDTNFVNYKEYLYRVGNADGSTVALGTIFKHSGKGTIDSANVSVAFETIGGNASGTFASNTSDWTKGTIQFTGTGVVRVTIKDDTSKEFVLNLEVIDATNKTDASSSNGADIVLLQNIKVSSNGTINYKNCTVYGNGFEIDVRGGMNQYNSKQGHGIIITVDAVLDNIVVEGDVYDSYGAYSTQEDYTSAIDATNTVIQNCHISNCSAPVRANGVTIINSTLYGGTVANLIISGGVNTLTDLTTVNYNDGRDVLGLGIVVSDGASENTRIVLEGMLKQYNYICKDDSSKVPGSEAEALFNSIFDDSFKDYKTSTGYVNTGIIIMTESLNTDIITDNANTGYLSKDSAKVTLKSGILSTTVDGAIYAPSGSNASVDNGYSFDTDNHASKVQGDYLPKLDFDLGDQTNSNDGADDTRYLIGDANGIESLHQNNETPNLLDLTKLASALKYNIPLSVSISYKGSDGRVIGTDTTVQLTESGTLIVTVVDNFFYNQNGEKINKSVNRTYEIPVTVSVKEAAIKNADIKVNKSEIKGDYNSSKYMTFNPLEAITVTDYDASGNGTTVALNKNIASKTVEYNNTSSGAWGGATITITYTDGRVLIVNLGTSTLNSPGASNGGKTITIQNDGSIKTDGKVANSSATGGTWTINGYSFKGNNGSTVTNNTKVTVTFADESGCVTGDTLVTLADGTQKRIDQVTTDDMLLVWNFYTGDYDAVPAAIIFYHGDELYDVVKLYFEDGTTVKVINNHGFYDVELDKFIFLDEKNADEYIGHKFVKVDGNGGRTEVALVGYEVVQEYTGCYSIQTAVHINFIVEGMFSLTIPPMDGWFDYFEIGEGMKYDEEKMQADIEKYGLYEYEVFEPYGVTYEQFIAFNGPYLKVLVGRGVLTFEEILALIATYVC